MVRPWAAGCCHNGVAVEGNNLVETVEDNPIRAQILDKGTRWSPHDAWVERRYVDIQELFDDDDSFLCFHLGLQSSDDGTSFGKVV